MNLPVDEALESDCNKDVEIIEEESIDDKLLVVSGSEDVGIDPDSDPI